MHIGSIPRLAVIVCLGVLPGCGASDVQTTGTYAFTASEIVRDNCGLLPDGESLWDGHVFVSGKRVWVEYSLFEMRLVGEYQEVSDTFIADGTAAGVSTEIMGRACLLDYVSVHLEGTTESETAFGGSMKVQYRSEGSQECRCDLEVRYHAERIGD